MPRRLRIQYPGAMYHVMSRGDGGGLIYRDDVDRHNFKTLAEAKLAIAPRLRRETNLWLNAIAARLCPGTSKSANGKLREFMKGGGQHDPPGHSQDTFKLEAHEAQNEPKYGLPPPT